MRAEDNKFPYLTLAEETAPTTPDAGSARLYVDSAGKLWRVDDAGAAKELRYAGEETSVHPYVLLESNGTAANVPAGTPVGALIAKKKV